MSDADLVELLLECRRLRLERLLALAQLLDLVDAVLDGGAFEAFHAFGDLLLLARHLLGLPLRVCDVARAARLLRLLQLALRLLQPLERGGRLRGAHLTAVGRRLPHLVGRLAHLPRGLHQLRPVLLARQLLEPARRFLDLIGELPLAVAAARAALLPGRALPLALGFLLLPPRQLLQLLGELVDLLIRLLLLGALRASRTGWPSCRARARTGRRDPRPSGSARRRRRRRPAALHADLDFVLLLGLLQELQRLLLERERAVGLACCSFASAVFISVDCLRQQLRNLLERRILLDQAAVHARDQPFDLLAQLRLRQRDDGRVLAQLVGRHRLAIAVDVERRGDDLALLLRQRADLLPPPPPPPPPPACDSARLKSLRSGRICRK